MATRTIRTATGNTSAPSGKVVLLVRTASAARSACRQLAEGTVPLSDDQISLLTALAADANLPFAYDAGANTCHEIMRIYTWFWDALRAIEAAVPETLDVLPNLMTPRSVLGAMDESSSGALSGMTFARYVIAAVVLRYRAARLISDAATADPRRPYAISAYPQVDGMHYVVLWYGDTPIAHASVSAHGDRVEDVTVVAPQRLPLVRAASQGWKMRPIDPKPAVARLLAGAVVNFQPEDRVGAFDVPEAVGNYVLYGPEPTRRLSFVRISPDILAHALDNLTGPALFVTRGTRGRDDTAADVDDGYESNDDDEMEAAL